MSKTEKGEQLNKRKGRMMKKDKIFTTNLSNNMTGEMKGSGIHTEMSSDSSPKTNKQTNTCTRKTAARGITMMLINSVL